MKGAECSRDARNTMRKESARHLSSYPQGKYITNHQPPQAVLDGQGDD